MPRYSAKSRTVTVDGVPFMVVAEAARALELSTESIRRLCNSGELAHIRQGPGRRRLIRWDSVQATQARRIQAL